MFCGNCGSKAVEGNLFCVTCGQAQQSDSASESVGGPVLEQPNTLAQALNLAEADVPAWRSRRGVVPLILAAAVVLVAGTAWAAQPWRSPSSAPSSGSGASALTAHTTPAVPSSAVASSPASSPAVTANPLETVTVGGTVAAPTLSFSHMPLTVKATTVKVIMPGKGATLSKANAIMFNYVLVNGKDGKQVESSFGKTAAGMDLSSATLLPGLGKGLTGQKVGSKLLVAIPPSDAFGAKGNLQAGFGPTDTVLFYIELLSASTPLTTATGVAVPPVAGLPSATVDGVKAAVVTVPNTAPPTALIVQPLIRGAGPVVRSGQNIKVSYTGVLWKNGRKFDASADHGSSFDTQIGAGKVITGWDKGLVGQTVGSRVLLIVPPAEGYGAKGSPPLIGATDTLVFVVDILAIV
jgi:peptidylprolyl isomerase